MGAVAISRPASRVVPIRVNGGDKHRPKDVVVGSTSAIQDVQIVKINCTGKSTAAERHGRVVRKRPVLGIPITRQLIDPVYVHIECSAGVR